MTKQTITKQTIFTSIVLGLCVVLATMLVLNNSKVKAAQELLALDQEEAELDRLIQEDSEGWWIDEEAKSECVESFSQSQDNRSKRNEKRRARKLEIQEERGLIMERKLQ